MFNNVLCAQPVTFQVRDENGTVIETKTVGPDATGMIDIELISPIRGSVRANWAFSKGPLLDPPLMYGDEDLQTKDND